MQSDPEVATRILKRLGGETSQVRNEFRRRRKKRKEYIRAKQGTEKYKIRRAASRQRQLHRMAADSKSCSRHRTDKVLPTVDGRAKVESSKKRKHVQKCSNCGEIGHNKSDCAEPVQDTSSNNRRRKKDDMITSTQIVNMLKK